MKIVYILSLLILFNLQGFTQDSPESIVTTFFYSVGEGNYTQAVESIVVTNPNLRNDSTMMNRLANNLKTAHTRNGVYCGYELIEKEEVTASYINYSYFIKFMENPVKIQFTFYKPRDKWQVNSVQLTPVKGKEQQEGRNQGNRNMKNGNNQNNPNNPNRQNQTKKMK